MHRFKGTPKSRKVIYETCLYSYGFLSLLRLLQELQDLEFYEDCCEILDVILKVSKDLDIDLPTTFDDRSIEIYKETYLELGGNPAEDPIEDSAKYALEIIKKLNR